MIGRRCFRSSYQESRDKTTVRAGSKSCLLCYTRERVNREEKETLQHKTTSLGIHFVCHPHQQNGNRSGSNKQSSQTLRATSPVLLSTSRCSQTPLEQSNVLSDSARAFSGAPESTCSCGGAFKMLRDLTYRIVKFRSS